MKILASDMDGTLFFHGHVHKRDIVTIQKFQQAGNKFGFCTGRFLMGAVDHNPKGLHPDFYIASSGAVILDKDLNVIFERMIPFEVGESIWNAYSKKYWMLIQAASKERMFLNTKLFKENIPSIIVDDYEIVREEKVHGLSIVTKTVNEALEVAKELLKKYPEIDAFVNKNSIDIVPKGCSKGSGSIFIQEYYNSDSIAGIGDSYNDIPMLEAVDVSFTFKKSPKEMREKVNHIVKSVAQAIHILMEEK